MASVRVESWNLHDVMLFLVPKHCASSFFYILSIYARVSRPTVTLIFPLIESFLARPIYRWFSSVKTNTCLIIVWYIYNNSKCLWNIYNSIKSNDRNKYHMNKKYEWNTEVTNFLNLQDDISLTTSISHNVLELISENAVFIIHMIKVERASVCFRVRRDNLKTQFPLHWNNVKFDMQYPVHRENDIRHDISFYRTFHPMVHRNALMRGSPNDFAGCYISQSYRNALVLLIH